MFYKKMIVLAAAMLCMEFAAFGMYAPVTVDTSKVSASQRTQRPVKNFRSAFTPNVPSSPVATAPTAQRTRRPAGYFTSYFAPSAPQVPSKKPITMAPIIPAQTEPITPAQPTRNMFQRLFGLQSESEIRDQRTAALKAREAAKETAFNEYIKKYNPYRGQATEEQIERVGRVNLFFTPADQQEEDIKRRQRRLARPAFEKDYNKQQQIEAEREAKKMEDIALEERALRQQAQQQLIQGAIQGAKKSGSSFKEKAQEWYQRFTTKKPQAPLNEEGLAAIGAVEKTLGASPEDIAEQRYWSKYPLYHPRRFVPGGIPAIEREAKAERERVRQEIEASKKAVQETQVPTWRKRFNELQQNIRSQPAPTPMMY